MKTMDYTEFLTELKDITSSCEGAGLVSEVNALYGKYETYFATTPVPTSVAKFVNNFLDLIDNVEGAELERELSSLRFPKVAK